MSQTHISNSIQIDGEITGSEPVEISGVVKGQILLQSTVTVASDGYLEADVDAETVKVNGTINGNASASERFEVLQGGKMIGNIKAPRIHIADGAAFKGHIDMDVE